MQQWTGVAAGSRRIVWFSMLDLKSSDIRVHRDRGAEDGHFENAVTRSKVSTLASTEYLGVVVQRSDVSTPGPL